MPATTGDRTGESPSAESPSAPYPSAPHPAGPYPAGPQQPWPTGQHPYGPTEQHGPAPHHGPAPRSRVVTRPIIATALIAGLLGGAVGVGGSALLDNASPAAVPVLSSQPDNARQAADVKPGSVTYAAQVASKSTADIQVATGQGTAVGSGIVLSPDGYVLTNNHVVAAAGNGNTIQVTTGDGKAYTANITGTSPSYDLAVIKLDGASGLTPATLGDSDSLQVGEQVVAVGSPENLSNTVTSGIVSALSRTVTAADESGSGVTVYNGLQTDTPINPGNSGGPLVNLQGEVVGVNSAVNTGQATAGGVQAYGLGFAIPVNEAKRIGDELLQNGEATKPVLGVTGSLAAANGSAPGAQVAGVEPGGAAADAGISEGDVITKVADTPVSNYADLMAQVLTHSPGDTVSLTVGSGDDARTVQVTLGSAVDRAQTTIPESGGQSNQPRLPFGGGYGLVP
ncbi:trypsin-like peptidase domain-containing protein [Gordonia sp. LSe1-13]|uniref:Trypsin-like peptidase domain-containing protein n=1 Tax=Gordonia sesuvii TaxID=3116777 RepID=A0ABU7MI78_9ACTN|nr:trypsin-like peptidase domain-containing protein [Gordonia sp. LSe1-13]